MRIVAAMFLMALLSGCSSGPRPTTSLEPVFFDWNPPSDSLAQHSSISMGVIAGTYLTDTYDQDPILKRFSINMGKDFLELLNAKGFSVSGPHRSLNEMTYPEKKGCDLILTPEIDLQPHIQLNEAHSNSSLLGPATGYRFSGVTTISGRITIAVRESLSGQRMWSKSVELQPYSAEFTTADTYLTNPPHALQLGQDRGLTSVQEMQLEKIYTEVLQKAWSYIDVQEMEQVKAAAQDVRAKTTFQGQ